MNEDFEKNGENENKEYNFVYSRRGFTENESGGRKKIKFIDAGKNKFLVIAVWLLIIILVTFGSAFFWLWQNGNLKITSFESDMTVVETPSISIEDPPENENALTADQVYEKTYRSVVGIAMYDYNANILSDLVGQGSGIIVSKDGHIITNSHVVGDSSQKRITVVFKNENDSEEVPARVIGFDKKTDLAVLKIDKKDLQPAVFGDSSKVKPGITCYALGNPGGIDFYSSITRGIVSAVNRSINKSEVKYIQTDTAINPGNSGGGLFNSYGQVIGMNTGKISAVEFEGMGFSIPSNTIKMITDDLIAKGYVSGRVCLGITAKMVSYFQSQMFDVPLGAIVVKLSPESRLTNVIVGDILTKVNDTKISSLEVLSGELQKHKAGEKVNLEVFRRPGTGENSKIFTTSAILLEDKNIAS